MKIPRRDFIATLGAAAAAPLLRPRAARAQQERVRRIGLVISNYLPADREGQARIAAFLDTMQKLGWSDGRNVRIDYRWDGGDIARIKASVADFVRAAPDVIVAVGNPPVDELHRLTSTIPVVFTQVGDAVESGLVKSLARPGGNVTGFQNFESAMGGKWLGVLKEAAPNLKRVAALFASDALSNVAFLQAAEAVAPALGVKLTAIDVEDADGMERSVATFAQQPDGGMVVFPHAHTIGNRGSIIILAARHGLPAIYPFRFFASEGGLLSYGPDQIEQWRGAAAYVDRILRGEKPGDLPVQMATKYELVVNMKTAKALGLTIPAAFPLRADEVIE